MYNPDIHNRHNKQFSHCRRNNHLHPNHSLPHCYHHHNNHHPDNLHFCNHTQKNQRIRHQLLRSYNLNTRKHHSSCSRFQVHSNHPCPSHSLHCCCHHHKTRH